MVRRGTRLVKGLVEQWSGNPNAGGSRSRLAINTRTLTEFVLTSFKRPDVRKT